MSSPKLDDKKRRMREYVPSEEDVKRYKRFAKYRPDYRGVSSSDMERPSSV